MTNSIMSVKTTMSVKHPLAQMLKMDKAAYDMQFINDFYVRFIEYTPLVFKWAVTSNDADVQFLLHFKNFLKIYLESSTQYLNDFQCSITDQLLWYIHYASNWCPGFISGSRA